MIFLYFSLILIAANFQSLYLYLNFLIYKYVSLGYIRLVLPICNS